MVLSNKFNFFLVPLKTLLLCLGHDRQINVLISTTRIKHLRLHTEGRRTRKGNL